MKLKLDENGHVVVQDGKPVYVHDDGKEIAFDAPQALAKITSLNSEAKQYREAKEQVETMLKAFDGLDADTARKALDTVKNLDDKKLIDAGEVEKVKAEAKKAYDEQLAKITAERDGIKSQFHTAMISSEFARSAFVKDKTILPPEIAQSYFGSHFAVDDNGKVIAKYADGNVIYSRSHAGEIASLDEALEILVGAYAHKDSILKGSNASGAGAGQAGHGSPNAPKSYAECKTDADKIAWLNAQAN